MGVELYLARDDNRTLFELGKTRTGFAEALRIHSEDAYRGITFTLPSIDELTVCLVVGATEWGSWDEIDEESMGEIAAWILEWSGGHPVHLIYASEASALRADHGFKLTYDRYTGKL